MKNFLTLCAIVGISFASVCAQAEPIKFVFAAEPYPPFAMKKPNGDFTGFEPDLIRMVCAEMKADCSLNEVAWSGIIPALQSKKYDVIFGSMSITADRLKEVNFSQPYYVTRAAFVAPQGSNLTLTPESLKGKRIGVQLGTTSADYLRKHYEGIAKVRYYDIQDSLNVDLVAGRVDAMLADEIAVQAFIKTPDAIAEKMEIKGHPNDNDVFGAGVGAALRKDDQALLDRINQALDKVLVSPEYDALSKKYFGINIGPKK